MAVLREFEQFRQEQVRPRMSGSGRIDHPQDGIQVGQQRPDRFERLRNGAFVGEDDTFWLAWEGCNPVPAQRRRAVFGSRSQGESRR